MSVENNDHNLDVFRNALGGEKFRLTDQEIEMRSRAGIFASSTFTQIKPFDLSEIHMPTHAVEFEEELLQNGYGSFLTSE